ncbi:MAG: patatin-like phospholipase family protein [Puniceicoccales bacterium]|nr:patatin-like phospholipase family protein [Puniceicoccales bacterium]
MRVVLSGTPNTYDQHALGISKQSAILSGVRTLFHRITLLAVVGSGSTGLLLIWEYLPWLPFTGTVFIVLAGVVAVPMTVWLILTLCAFCSKFHKKRLLQDYIALVQKNPDIALPGYPSKKLRDWLNTEWEISSQFALMQSTSAVKQTIMGDPQVFKSLQEGKFTSELEMFRGFLKKDLTRDQRQKVTELEAQMRKRFIDEMKRLTASTSTYSPRMRYSTMVDFFIIQEDDMIKAAIAAGLTDCKLPQHELKISHLSMSGGGARGYAYGEMFKKLKPTFMPNCRFSGTSAGAIGALIAAVLPDSFDEIVSEMQKRYNKSARSNPNWISAYGWLRAQYASWPGYYDLIGVLALFDEQVQNKVSGFLQNIPESVVEDIFSDDPAALERMRILREPYDVTKSREGKMLTFHDLELLQRLPGGKEQFHDLAAAIWDKTDGKSIFAKKETQPNMSVVLAVCASMSIPLAFKFLALPLENSGGKPHQLCDGAYGTNLPIQAFEAPQEETYGVIFDWDGWGGRTLCGDIRSMPRVIRWGVRILGIASNIEANVQAERKKMLQSRDQLLILPHGGITMLDFGFSAEKKKEIKHEVALRVEAWKICKMRGTNWPQSIWSTLIYPLNQFAI